MTVGAIQGKEAEKQCECLHRGDVKVEDQIHGRCRCPLVLMRFYIIVEGVGALSVGNDSLKGLADSLPQPATDRGSVWIGSIFVPNSGLRGKWNLFCCQNGTPEKFLILFEGLMIREW